LLLNLAGAEIGLDENGRIPIVGLIEQANRFCFVDGGNGRYRTHLPQQFYSQRHIPFLLNIRPQCNNHLIHSFLMNRKGRKERKGIDIKSLRALRPLR
jgi:hypothetical protein